MSDNDVTKMKVADLKRELKLRGLATTGNKNELQDRLQAALLDGDVSLDETGINEDLEVGELTDEDEEKLLIDDENELLKSPASTPTSNLTDLLLSSPPKSLSASIPSTNVLTTPAKKIILKRNNSQHNESAAAINTTKENTMPKAESIAIEPKKVSLHKPITFDNGIASPIDGGKRKLIDLSEKERLELRVKKFGKTTNETPVQTLADKVSDSSILANNGNAETEQKQIELLKKRAERFGCVVSSKVAQLNEQEKLLKRKERFGPNATDASTTAKTIKLGAASSTAETDVWAEKARQRLERFKTAPAN